MKISSTGRTETGAAKTFAAEFPVVTGRSHNLISGRIPTWSGSLYRPHHLIATSNWPLSTMMEYTLSCFHAAAFSTAG